MDSSILVTPYDDRWPERFEDERDRLRTVFHEDDIEIEHIGSTAVPGLVAKPIIDVVVGAPSLTRIEARVKAMTEAGYHYVPEYESVIPDRRYFRRPAGRPRRAHIHAVVTGGEIWARHITFRDWLRTHPDDRDAYAGLKLRLVTESEGDRDRYLEGKAPFIRGVLERAQAAVRSLLLVAAAVGVTAGAPLTGSRAFGAAAQNQTVVGVVLGVQETDGLWRPSAESESVRGALAGVTVEAASPSSWLTVLAEISLSQRNSNVVGTIEGEALQGGLRTDYLSILLGPRFSVGVGPVRLHLTPALGTDQVIRARIDPTLSPILRERATVFGVTGIVGVGTTIGDRYRIDVEARVHEGLGEAHSGDFVGMRNRTVGLSTRVAIPIPEALRPGR